MLPCFQIEDSDARVVDARAGHPDREQDLLPARQDPRAPVTTFAEAAIRLRQLLDLAVVYVDRREPSGPTA